MKLRVRHSDEAEKEPFHYQTCGLDDVYLTNGYDVEDTPHGVGVTVRKVDEVLRAIGLFLVANKKQLSGNEIRFLRHQMDYTQSELARMLGVSSQQVARYEKDKNGSNISGASDRILRLLYREQRDELVAALKSRLGADLTVNAPDQGMHLVAYTRKGLKDTAIERAGREHGVIVRAMGRLYVPAAPRSALVLGFSGHQRATIIPAVERLARAVEGQSKSASRARAR